MSDLRKAAQLALEPQVGETWHTLRVGATACQTRTVAEITPLTVVFKPVGYEYEGERWPRRDVEFLERVSFAANPPPRKRLTDARIYALYKKAELEKYYPRDFLVQYDYDKCIEEFVRAIEKEHGIGGEA